MNTSRPELPGYWEFALMFFMQPFSLHKRLLSCGIESPDLPAWRLWNKSEATQHFLERTAALLFSAIPASLAVGLLFQILGLSIDFSYLSLGIALGVLLGYLLIFALNTVAGAAFGLFSSIPLGIVTVALKGTENEEFNIIFATCIILSNALGFAAHFSTHITKGVEPNPSKIFNITIGGSIFSVFIVFTATILQHRNRIDPSTLGLEDLAWLFLTICASGFFFGGFASILYGMALFRLPLYPFEASYQFFIYLRRLKNKHNLRLSPIFWHELSYLPLPWLGKHIEATALETPDLAREAIGLCISIPGQRELGKSVLSRLQVRELVVIGRDTRYEDFLDGNTLWQADEADADAITARFWQTARYLQAAKTSVLADQQLEHLNRAQKALRDLERSLLDVPKRSPYPWKQAVNAWQGTVDALYPWKQALYPWKQAVSAWQGTVDALRAEAQQAAKDRIPNPFRAGDPLTPDRGGSIFRGRQDIVQQIERQLVDPKRSGSIALLAPRRCGKTSLLQMLPKLLPDTVCIFFDLQGHPVDTPTGFFQALDEQVFLQARRQRGFKLPRLQEGNPFEQASRWFDALEVAFQSVFDGRRLLICLDEFAALENSFSQDETSLHKLMGLFRSTIQHRRHVRLLVAGEAPFDELNAMWNDYFISVRQIRFGHLEPSEAFDLVRQPTPEFPNGAIPEPVARHIVERTGSQPFLVQLFAQILVERLNDAQRIQATLDDLEPVEEEAMEQGHYYFSNTWQRAPAGAQEILAALARNGTSPLERTAVRWLKRRHLIDDDHRLTIPVLGRFLIDEELV